MLTVERFAKALKPPYWAVIFTAQRTPGDDGYGEMAALMDALAPTMSGYLGHETTRDEAGFGITVSYWQSEQAIRNWRIHAEHRIAQERGRSTWYEHYEMRIAKVERGYSGP